MPCEGPIGCDHAQDFQDLDRLTRFVCELIEAGRVTVPDYLADWHHRHQERDRRRREDTARDAIRRNARDAALAKLTQVERDALGLR